MQYLLVCWTRLHDLQKTVNATPNNLAVSLITFFIVSPYEYEVRKKWDGKNFSRPVRSESNLHSMIRFDIQPCNPKRIRLFDRLAHTVLDMPLNFLPTLRIAVVGRFDPNRIEPVQTRTDTEPCVLVPLSVCWSCCLAIDGH